MDVKCNIESAHCCQMSVLLRFNEVKMRKATICFIWLVMMVTQLAAVFHTVGYYPGTGQTGQIAICDNFGYLASGNDGLCVLDLSDPTNPEPIAIDSTGIAIYQIEAAGDYVYALGQMGYGIRMLQIFNVAVPTMPVLISTTNVHSFFSKLVLSDNKIYFGWAQINEDDSYYWLDILDVANPNAPVPLCHYAIPAYPLSLCIVGSTGYLADDEGLRILDIANPTAPQIIGSYPLTNGAADVVVQDSLAYVSGQELWVLNVRNPSNPILIGQNDSLWLNAISIRGNTLYGMISEGYGFKSVDITIPQNPVLQGYYSLLGSNILTINGDYAYISHSQRGLHAIDVSEPVDVTLIGNIETEQEACAVTVDSGVAYVANYDDGFKAFNISDPLQPALLGSINSGRRINDVCKSGNYAYLASGYWDGEGGLEIMDVSNPANPELLSYVPVQDYAAELAISGNIAYVTDNFHGLKIFNVSNPANPIQIGSYNPGSYVLALAVSGNIVCLVGYSCLWIVDVTNPQNPIERGVYYLDNGRSVAISGNVAYVADAERGILLIDISNPDAPTLLSTLTPHTENNFMRCKVDGNRLYTMEFIWNEVLIYDITNPMSPVLTKRYDSNFTTGDVCVSGNLLYTCNREYKDIGIHDINAMSTGEHTMNDAVNIHLSNFPNPFSSEMNIVLKTKDSIPADISIYNVKGQLIRKWKNSKAERLVWDGKDASGRLVGSGLYLIKAAAGKHRTIAKVIRL